MNIIVLNGSPRTLGNCDKLINAALSAFSREDKVKRFDMYKLLPTPCNACGYCKAADGCSKKDLEEFLGYYAEADVVIVATPVYNYSMPAPLKALFDRFQRFYEATHKRGIENPFERHKSALLIVASGGDGRIGFEVIKKQVEGGFENMNTKLCASVLFSETDSKQLSDADLAKARELVRYI